MLVAVLFHHDRELINSRRRAGKQDTNTTPSLLLSSQVPRAVAMAALVPEKTASVSPNLRAFSPSPSRESTPALSPSISISPNRSFSNVSSLTSQSSRSSNRSCSLPSSTSRRRGYVRPQGATFAPSAQNRDSVLSLGSIAHLQYYFARTGLLEGKGGQLAKTKQNGEYDLPIPSRYPLRRTESDVGSSVTESPVEDEGALLWDAAQEDGEDVMLPPTVSTYAHRSHSVSSPPDQKSLKRDLVDALENALHALEEVENATASQMVGRGQRTRERRVSTKSRGFTSWIPRR